MNIKCLFGIGSTKIMSENNTVDGIITNIKVCWWLKINKKPIRTNALDGAVFPYIIQFKYIVNGKEYYGTRFINLSIAYPQNGSKIKIYYKKNRPSEYTVEL